MSDRASALESALSVLERDSGQHLTCGPADAESLHQVAYPDFAAFVQALASPKPIDPVK